jgi:hypothetical protein
MTKRWLVWLTCGVCVAAAAGIGTWLQMPRPCPVVLANYERIQDGMRLAEVEAVLGGPPGIYGTGMVMVAGPGVMSLNARYESWWTDEGLLLVRFDQEGRSSGSTFCGGVLLPSPGPFVRLRTWLGW